MFHQIEKNDLKLKIFDFSTYDVGFFKYTIFIFLFVLSYFFGFFQMRFLVLGDSNLRNAQQYLYQDEPLKMYGYISNFFKFFFAFFLIEIV